MKLWVGKLAALVFVVVAHGANGETKSKRVPAKLFEVELKTYRFTDGGFTKSDLPVAKITGVEEAGNAKHLFFQPRKVYEMFPYVEHRKKPDDVYFETSFHMYIMPVLPVGAKTLDELKEQKDWEYDVLRLDWSQLRDVQSDEKKRRSEDYQWAQSLCKIFEVDLGVKPVISDSFMDSKFAYYSCTFADGTRVLKVSSFIGREVELEYSKKVNDAKVKTFESKMRRLLAPAIRPY